MEQYIVEEYEKLSEDAKQLSGYITIDMLNLEEALVNHAAGYIYLAQHASAARGQLSAIKNKMEAIRGELFYAFKVGGGPDGKALTDETVKAMVSKDAQMQQVKQELALAEMDDIYWASVMNAMNQRGFFLRELFTQDTRNRFTERQYPATMEATIDELSIQSQQRGKVADGILDTMSKLIPY